MASGRKKQKNSYAFIFSSPVRPKIYNLCMENPHSYTELKKKVNISDGALQHHIKIMVSAGILTKEIAREGDKYKQGKEIKLQVTPENQIRMQKYSEEQKEKARIFFNEKFPEEAKIKLLEAVRKHQPIQKRQLYEKLAGEGFNDDIAFLVMKMVNHGKIDEIIKLSKEGEEYLKANRGGK